MALEVIRNTFTCIIGWNVFHFFRKKKMADKILPQRVSVISSLSNVP